MNIYRIASPIDKIKRYNITDPFLIFFTYNYENMIDWNKIKKETSVNDMNAQIKEDAIPRLYQKIDRTLVGDLKERKKDETIPRNNYVKDINIVEEILRAGHIHGGGVLNEEIQECKKVKKEKGYEAAKQLRLSQLNDAKEKAFKKWWDQFHEGNTLIPSIGYNPALCYILLKMAFDGSKEKEKKPTFQINPNAIVKLAKKIKESNGEKVRLIETYQGILNEINAADIELNPNNPRAGWLRIKSKINDPENYDENLQKLIDFSTPNGWCTSAGHGDTYLSQGDFWLYLVDNHAKVALRFEGNSLAEIEGERNEVPYEYFEEIFEFINKKSFQNPQAIKYLTLKEAEKINRTFNMDLWRPITFDEYLMLTKENRNKISENELRQAIAHASKDSMASYHVAQFFNFDVTKIGNEKIIDKITANKLSTDSKNSVSTMWSWPPWKWIMAVKFRLEKIPEKIIECIAYNDFTALEFARWKAFNKEQIPESIIEKIAQNPKNAFVYAEEALYRMPLIPDSIVTSIAKDSKLFVQFAFEANLNIRDFEEKYRSLILKNPELCALVCKSYDYDKAKIPPEIWEEMIKSPIACVRFAAGVNFDEDRIPPELLAIIAAWPDACMSYAEKTGWNSAKIPKDIIKTISKDIDLCNRFIIGINYNFTNIPESIIDMIATSQQSSYAICSKLEFDEKKIPQKFIEIVAKNPDTAANFALKPNYKIENLPEIIKISVATSLSASMSFSEARKFKTEEIPIEIIIAVSSDPEKALEFFTSVLHKWKNLNFLKQRTRDFVVERDVPPAIIDSISKVSNLSLRFASLMDYNIVQIPESIKNGIAKIPENSLSFAQAVNYNYTKLTKQMIDAISSNYRTSAMFMSGVNFDKNRIDPRMIIAVSKAFREGKRDFKPKNSLQLLLEKNKYDFSLFDRETSEILEKGISTNPMACLNFVKAKNAMPDQIPQSILNSIASDPFLSLGYARIARYIKKQIPIPIIDSISRSPNYCFSYAQGCAFNFYKIPEKILASIRNDPKLMEALKLKYAEFKKLEHIKEMEVQPSKSSPSQPSPSQQIPSPNPYKRKPKKQREEGLAHSSVKIRKLSNQLNQEIYMQNSIKITKIAKNKAPDAETLALCVLALKVYLKDNENIPKKYKILIEKLPVPRKIRQDFSLKECEVLYETVEYLWKAIIKQEIIPEKEIQKAPEKMCGNYLMINNGILLKGVNTYDIIKRNSSLICSLLNINGMTLQEYLSLGTNELIRFIIKSGALRLFITKDGRVYGQCSPEIYGKWARRKIQKLDFKKKVLKIIDLSQKYCGWESGITTII